MLYTFCIVAFIKSYTLLPSFFLFLHKYRFPSSYRMCNILVTCHELWWHCKDWMSDNLRGITVVFCCLLRLWSKHYGISGSFLKLALEISIVVSFYSSFLMFLAWNVFFFFFFFECHVWPSIIIECHGKKKKLNFCSLATLLFYFSQLC